MTPVHLCGDMCTNWFETCSDLFRIHVCIHVYILDCLGETLVGTKRNRVGKIGVKVRAQTNDCITLSNEI